MVSRTSLIGIAGSSRAAPFAQSRAAAPPNQGAVLKMLIGAPPKWTLADRVRGPYTRSGAGRRLGSEAIRRQPLGNHRHAKQTRRIDDIAGVSEHPASIAKPLFAACRVR